MLNKNAIGYLSIAIAYVISGKAALMLALPPGYASAIFPPAGIAVAAAFIAGRRTLPWVFLGSIFLNIWVSYSARHQIDTTGFTAASIIAAASMLQAAVGGWALRRAVGYPAAFDNVRAIFQFLLLAPLACLTSASLSVSGLWVLGIFDTGSLAGNWFSWWIGDSLGVMVLLPITMVFAGEPRALWRSRMLTVALPMALIFALFVAMFLKTNQWEQDDTLAEFRQISQQSLSQIQAKLEEQTSVLMEMRGLFVHDVNGNVTRQEFQRFTQGILVHFPMIQAIEWAPRVDSSQRASFEAAQRKDIPDFEIKESASAGNLRRASDRNQFYPVTYLEPLAGNEPALGFDLASTPLRQEALVKATTKGLVNASAPIRLVQANGQTGMLIMQSVKLNGRETGVVLSVLKVQDFIDKILPPSSVGLHIRLIDNDGQNFIYDNFESNPTKILFEHTFDFGTRHYRLQTMPTAAYFKLHRGWQSWSLLAVGTFGTGLLGALLLLGTGYTARIEEQVAERTRELKNSEEKLSSIYEGSNDAIMLLTEEAFFDCNSRTLELFGLGSKAELISTHPSQLSPPIQPDGRDSFTVANEKIATAFKTGSIRFEWMHRRKNGEDFPAEVLLSAFSYQGKKVLQATVRDITERKRIEDKLVASSREIEDLYNHAPCGYHSLDKSGVIVNVNDTELSWLGYTREEIVGKMSWQDLITPDGLRIFQVNFPVLIEQGYVDNLEIEIIRKNGTTFLGLISATAINDVNGNFLMSRSTVNDITDRKNMERQLKKKMLEFQTILDSASVGITFIRDRKQIWVNQRMADLFGYTQDEMVGRSTRIYYKSQDDFDEFGKNAYAALSRGELFRSDMNMRHHDGSTIWIDVSGKAIDSGDLNAGSIWVLEDITERKEAEIALRTLNETLESRVRGEVARNLDQERMLIQQARLAAMGEMISNIAHQWRQPLNALALMQANIKDDFEYGELNQEAMDKFVNNGQKIIQKMSSTIDDFRDFFRPNKIKENFDVTKTIDGTLNLISHGLKNHNITVRVASGHEIFANGFPNEFSQVLLNIVNNAKDAMLEKKVAAGEIDIALGEEGAQVWVTIRDNAGGISQDILPKIFDPYFTTKESGTGIGLYMSKMIMEHMDGAIETRNVDEGAEFRLTLPKPSLS